MSPIKESLIALAAVLILSHLAALLQFIPIIGENLALITAVLLLYIPMFIYTKKREKIEFFEQNFKEVFQSLKIFLIFSAAIFPLVFLGNHFYQQIFWHNSYQVTGKVAWGTLILVQILMVALPEELFFRGYFLERWNRVFPKRYKLWGAEFGPALFITSLIFALSHSVITVQWWHIFIFFPSLAFSWLKERTGRILAPVLFHASCNLFAAWVASAY